MPKANMLQSEIHGGVLRRLEELSPSSPALRGKMNAAQMLAHPSMNLEMSVSHGRARQTFKGRLFGGRAKRQMLRDGMPKNISSSPHLIVADSRHFGKEKDALTERLARFLAGGEGGVTRQPHPFFGRLTPAEWARLHDLHIDHHFRQFGI